MLPGSQEGLSGATFAFAATSPPPSRGSAPPLERGLPTRLLLEMAHREGGARPLAIFWGSSVVRRALPELSRSTRAKAAFSCSPCLGDARQPVKWPSCPSGRLGKSGPGPPSGKGPPAPSNAVRWPKMAHREGVPRTRPQNRDFLGFCRFCGAEGISRA